MVTSTSRGPGATFIVDIHSFDAWLSKSYLELGAHRVLSANVLWDDPSVTIASTLLNLALVIHIAEAEVPLFTFMRV